MEANEFIKKLKAEGSECVVHDLTKVLEDFKVILAKLPTKDRAALALNVLCTICRNIEKSPKWRDRIDNKPLLTLSIECVRETRSMDRADRVKTLACIYHIHKHVVRQTTLSPPELILKLSFMPFEVDTKHLLNEYNKTYWNILADRLTYIEKIKTTIPIVKLLPKLTEDLLKVIDIYDLTQFCTTILVFLVKKLHSLYSSSHTKDLNKSYGDIFKKISSKDLKCFKKLSDAQIFELYAKFNDCIYVVAENSSRMHFCETVFDAVVRTGVLMLGHKPAFFHCLQTFYLNSFSCLLTNNTDTTYKQTILNGLLLSFECTEKLGYKKELIATYPHINQLLRLFIDYYVNNCNEKLWKDYFDIELQEICLKILLILMKKLQFCEQLLKCDNCTVKSGLHDSLRLSFLIKHFVTISVAQKMLITSIIPLISEVINEQYEILRKLQKLKCINYEKCFRKNQTDIHNLAITLNKASYFEFSIKLFDIYLKYEISEVVDCKNISRALYNKSICELDAKMFEKALVDAFISLIFSKNDGLSSEKYMSLVMDIKAKELKASEEDGQTDKLQMFTVLDAVKMLVDNKLYGDLKFLVDELEFSDLLTHEFSLYCKLWPSIAPVGGVWRALYQLYTGVHDTWIRAEPKPVIIWKLYDIILRTCSVVRTIHSEYYSDIIHKLIQDIQDNSVYTEDLQLVHASLLFLQAEYDLAAASTKYGWKSSEPIQTLDPDQIPATRTLPQEIAAMKNAVEALAILNKLVLQIDKVTQLDFLRQSLVLYEIFVHQFVHLSRLEDGLQLAYICCLMAEKVDEHETYIRCTGVLLYSLPCRSRALTHVMADAGRRGAALGDREHTMDIVISFMCDAAIHYCRLGSVGVAAKLLRLAQGKILTAYEKYPNINLDISVGSLLECQNLLCRDSNPSYLSAVTGTHRHYLSVGTHGPRWFPRRLRALHSRARAVRAGARCAGGWRRVKALGRAGAAAGAALPSAAALSRAQLYILITDVNNYDDAQIKIDNRIKHSLGLPPTTDSQPHYKTTDTPVERASARQELESMLDARRGGRSPTLAGAEAPRYRRPESLRHAGQCACHECGVKCTLALCRTTALEAAMYCAAGQELTAREYYQGAKEIIDVLERKLQDYKQCYKCEEFVLDGLKKVYGREFKQAVLEIYIGIAFLELKCKQYDVTDDYIVQIHEIMEELGTVDGYISNEVMNLMVASSQYRKIVKIPTDLGLESEFESMKLTPQKEYPKTPETKVKPPAESAKKIVKDEEIFKKRKVIKLNLEEGDEQEFEVKKKTFKIPVPKTRRAHLEPATPRPQREKPSIPKPSIPEKPTILVTQPSQDLPSSAPQKPEFSTPCQSSPEQFFTPMTSVKCYTKKSLRNNIVKNLENEFSTPKTGKIEKTIDKIEKTLDKSTKIDVNKENLRDNGRSKSRSDKRTLRRATSPGELEGGRRAAGRGARK